MGLNMAITYEFVKQKILVTQAIDGLDDVIYKVLWTFNFTDGKYNSSGSGETYFDMSNLDNFTETSQVTDAKLEEWIIEKSFGANWGFFVQEHEARIRKQAEEEELDVYYKDENIEEPCDCEECQDERSLELLRKLLPKLGIQISE